MRIGIQFSEKVPLLFVSPVVFFSFHYSCTRLCRFRRLILSRRKYIIQMRARARSINILVFNGFREISRKRFIVGRV